MSVLRLLKSLPALAALLLGSVLTSCSDTTGNSTTPYSAREIAVSVMTEPARLSDLRETLTSVGTARALKSVSVYAETSGRVTSVLIDADATVSAGDLLLQLDDRDERLAVELASVKLADAERLVKRYTTVNARDANIPESQLDDARAAVDSARIALEQARVDLDRRRITAPFDGRVGITEIDEGDRIDTNTLVTTIDDRSTLLINFSVPEVYVDRNTRHRRQRQTVGCSMKQSWARSGRRDLRIDVSSRAFVARAAINNEADKFRPGMAFEISVNASRGAFLSVPDVAVQWGADGAYVWVADEGRASRREVRLVKRLAGAILIEGDVSEGESVVMEGIQAVRAGVRLSL